MNPKYSEHEPKKLPVYPVEVIRKPKKVKDKIISTFRPLLSPRQKEEIKGLTQHQRVLFLKRARSSRK